MSTSDDEHQDRSRGHGHDQEGDAGARPRTHGEHAEPVDAGSAPIGNAATGNAMRACRQAGASNERSMSEEESHDRSRGHEHDREGAAGERPQAHGSHAMPTSALEAPTGNAATGNAMGIGRHSDMHDDRRRQHAESQDVDVGASSGEGTPSGGSTRMATGRVRIKRPTSVTARRQGGAPSSCDAWRRPTPEPTPQTQTRTRTRGLKLHAISRIRSVVDSQLALPV